MAKKIPEAILLSISTKMVKKIMNANMMRYYVIIKNSF